VDNPVSRKLRTIVLTLTLAGGTLLSAVGGCADAGAKDVFSEAARVDAADYNVWRSNFGNVDAADYNDSGSADAADYVVWR
jgi:hypothetical protein